MAPPPKIDQSNRKKLTGNVPTTYRDEMEIAWASHLVERRSDLDMDKRDTHDAWSKRLIRVCWAEKEKREMYRRRC
jgi:hypothetical protein